MQFEYNTAVPSLRYGGLKFRALEVPLLTSGNAKWFNQSARYAKDVWLSGGLTQVLFSVGNEVLFWEE